MSEDEFRAKWEHVAKDPVRGEALSTHIIETLIEAARSATVADVMEWRDVGADDAAFVVDFVRMDDFREALIEAFL